MGLSCASYVPYARCLLHHSFAHRRLLTGAALARCRYFDDIQHRAKRVVADKRTARSQRKMFNR